MHHQNINRFFLTDLLAILLVMSLATLLVSCSNERAAAPKLAAGKPALLRAIENSVLSVVVRVEPGAYEFSGKQRTDGTWFVSMDVPADMTYNFVASWYANTKQKRVLLLEQRGQFFAGTDTNVEPIGATEDVSVGNGFDTDCDGMSNLVEMENDTDPLSIPSSCSVALPDTQAPMADFALGGRTLCLIDVDGHLECTTNFDEGAHLPPDDGTLYKKVGAGSVHACAVTQSGDIRCWGDNDFGQLNNIPTSQVGFVDLSAGRNHTCALDANGQAYCWGLNTTGQTDVPASDQQFTSIHASTVGTCAMRTSGIALCWSTEPGYNSAFIASKAWIDITYLPWCGLTGEGFIECVSSSSALASLMNGPYTRIGSAGGFSCGLQTDGYLDCLTYESQLAESNELNQATLMAINAFPPLVDFELLTSGPASNGVCGLGIDGKVYCAGNRLPADNTPG